MLFRVKYVTTTLSELAIAHQECHVMFSACMLSGEKKKPMNILNKLRARTQDNFKLCYINARLFLDKKVKNMNCYSTI